MKRNVMSWNEFKSSNEELPVKKGKATDPEFSKRKSGKSSGGQETLEDAKKHSITNSDKKGKKGKMDVMDDTKKTTIKDESQLKDAKKETKEIVQASNDGVEKTGDLPKVGTNHTEDIKYAKKKLKVGKDQK